MIDFGLLLSVILAFGVPSLLAQHWPISSFEAVPTPGRSVSGQAGSGKAGQTISFVDAVLASGAAAVIVGRMATLILDDPSAIGRIHDMLIIRSGVEFWPGVAAAVVWSALAAKRSGVGPLIRLLALLPLSMIGYAIYESSCIFRSGCAGPVSVIGLRPDGIGARSFPVGIAMGIAIIIGAIAIHRLTQSDTSPAVLLSLGALLVAGVRSIGSFWLPKLGDGLTRQHQTSLVIAVVSIALVSIAWFQDSPSAQ